MARGASFSNSHRVCCSFQDHLEWPWKRHKPLHWSLNQPSPTPLLRRITTNHSESLQHGLFAEQFSSAQFSRSVVSDSLQPHRLHGVHSQTSLSITNSQSLLKLMSIESVMPCNHLILCHPLLLPPSIFPSIRGFSNESVLYIRWPKYWSFSFSISPSNEYSGLISFRNDSFVLLAVQGTLKSLLQHHSSYTYICTVHIHICTHIYLYIGSKFFSLNKIEKHKGFIVAMIMQFMQKWINCSSFPVSTYSNYTGLNSVSSKFMSTQKLQMWPCL